MQSHLNSHYCACSTHLLCRTVPDFLVKLNAVNIWPSNPTFRYLPEKWKRVHIKICIQLLTPALFIITNTEAIQMILNWGMGKPIVGYHFI